MAEVDYKALQTLQRWKSRRTICSRFFCQVCVLRNPDVLLLRCFACFGFLGQMYPLGWIRPQYLHDFSI